MLGVRVPEDGVETKETVNGLSPAPPKTQVLSAELLYSTSKLPVAPDRQSPVMVP